MSYERIINDKKFDGLTRESHELRYRIAAGFCEKDDLVLDAGCGTGYGKDVIKRRFYVGIDKNPPKGDSFIEFNFEKKENELPIEYLYDVFIGFEIIEHLNEVGVKNFVKMAKQAQKFILVSTPIIRNSNPYHKQQFSPLDICRLFIDEEWKPYGTYKEAGIIQNEIYGIFIFKKI